MNPFQTKIMNEAFNIATELERKNFMFEHGLQDAASLEDMDAHNARVMGRGRRRDKEKFKAIYQRNLYACYLGLDIRRDFYKNIYSYKKPLYKIRKGENLVLRLAHVTAGANFQ